MDRAHDLVIYGATGYSGRQAVVALERRAPNLRWAVAGRDELALRSVAARCGASVVVADARDRTALDRLAADAKVVISFVGPHGPLGDELPRACVAAGTHYADLCGEQDVIARRIDELDATAQSTQVKLVPACGYESVPFDLCALALDDEFSRADGSRLGALEVTIAFTFHGGPLRVGHGTSGGTFATLARSATEVPGLTGAFDAGGGELRARRDGSGRWLAPALPDPFLNPATLRRSFPGLTYREATDVSATVGARMAPVSARVISAVARRMAAISKGRRSLGDRAFLRALMAPRPGEGPPIDSLDKFDYRIAGRARSTSGRRASATLAGTGNPGYRSSPRIMVEAGVALASTDKLPERGGVLTPAQAFGLPFLERLPAAGLRLELGGA